MMATGSVRITTKALGQVEEEDDAHNSHRQGELDDLVLQGVDAPVDEVGSVIGDHYLHSGRQRRRDVAADLLLDPLDDVEHVLAEAHDHDAARHLALTVEIGDPAPDLRAHLHIRHVFHEDGCAVLIRAQGDILQIPCAFDVASAADHVLGAGEFEQPAFHIEVARSYGVHDLVQGDVVRFQPHGVDIDLILLHEAADGGYLGDARHAFQAEFHGVVLDGAEVCKVEPAGLVLQDIGEPPAEARCIRSEHGIDTRWNPVLYSLDVFQDPAAGPVDVRALIEDYVDKGRPEEGESPDGLDSRGSEQGR